MLRAMQDADAPLAEGPANVLYERENVNAARVAWTVRLFGNWVGGRVRLYADRLEFEMNRMNRALQHDRGGRAIAAGEVTGVGFGKAALGLGTTVDLATARGPLRIRCGGRLRARIAEAARGWAAADGTP